MAHPVSLRRNICSNVGGYLVSVAAAFLIAPITIRSLGDVRYGAWSLVCELIGYYGLLDLGIRGAVTYYVARYSAKNMNADMKETLATAFWMLSLCGIFAFVIGVGVTAAFPKLFRTEGLDLREIRQSLLIMSGLIALSLPMNTFAGGLVGKERFDINTGVEALNRVLTTTAIYFVLKAGGGLVALALVQAMGRLSSWALIVYASRNILGGVLVRPAWIKWDKARALFGYGFRNAVGQVAMLVIYRMDLTVLGMFAGMQRVTYYSIAGTLVSYASSLCSTITFAFTPRFTHLRSSGAFDQLNHLYFTGLRITGMLVSGLAAGMLVFGGPFIRLWVGDAYVSGPWTERSDVVMVILILANAPRMAQSISWQRLFAMARVRFLMWLNICEAAANLCLSLFLVRHYGPAGVALGTFFPLVLSHVLVMPLYISRAFGLRLSELFRKGFAPSLLNGAIMGCVGLAFLYLAPPTSWSVLFLDILATTAFGAISCFAFGLDGDQRRALLTRLQLIRGPLNRT